MRVGIIGLLQESNTFLPEKTTWEHFEGDVLARGEQVRHRFAGARHEIGGFFQGLAQQDIEAVPIFAARALPYGVIDQETFARLMAEVGEGLKRAGRLDGLLVAPHGATVSEAQPDADGYWLAQVRKRVGLAVPIIGTIDPHANLSQAMVRACDALIAYRTNPHIDQHERGIEAAELMGLVLRKQVKPTMAAQFPPLAISIECQCTEEPPCRELVDIIDVIRNEADVLSVSIVLGFPYADVPEMGSALIVVTDNNLTLAEDLTARLAEELWKRKHALVQQLPGAEEAIEQAITSPAPVCLLDTGDNVGGGSPGDATWLAHALLKKNVDGALVCLCDPKAVVAAEKAGSGATISLKVGGQSVLGGAPVAGQFRVVSLHQGKFHEDRPRHGGFSTFDQGPTAVLTQKGLTVVVTSQRMVPFSLAQLTSCDLDPASFQMLAAKGVNAPIAAYRPVCRSFLRVATPGVTAADMTSLVFRHRRVPLFPFEQQAAVQSGDH